MSERAFRRILPDRPDRPDRQVPAPEPRPVATHRCLRCLEEFAVPEEGSCAVYAGVPFPVCLGCHDVVRPFVVSGIKAVAREIVELL